VPSPVDAKLDSIFLSEGFGIVSSDEKSMAFSFGMAPVLGAATCTKLVERVLEIENVKDVRELRPLLQRT
jgi:hypothetical protein